MSLWERICLLLNDLRYALRNLRLAPGFALAAILTLALGVGANTAIFSVVNGVLLRPLPYHDPDELVMIYAASSGRGTTRSSMSQPDLRDIQVEVESIEAAAGYQAYGLTVTGLGEAEVVDGATVTDGLLRIFREAPFLGRDILTEENIPDGPRVVVIGHAFWQERFGGDPSVVGRKLEVEGAAHEIVGVAPPGFDFPSEAQLWIPLHLNTEDCGRDCHLLRVVARLAPGATLGAARSEATVLARRLEQAFPEENYDQQFNVISLEEQVVGDVRTGLLVLLGAVGMVLLIACANVANLLLARASSRSGEMALRSALGASRGRIVQQLLLEAVVLATLGGAVGVVLARFGLGALLNLAPATLPRADNVVIDANVLVFSLLAVVLIALLFGLAPALRSSRVSASAALNQSTRGATAGSATDLSRSSLLVAEVALSLMLLFGAGLLLRSFSQLTAVDLGFDKEDVLTFRLSLPDAQYQDPDQVVQFFSSFEQGMLGLPGVESIGSVFGSPLGSARARAGVQFLDREPPPPGQEEEVVIRVTTPGYHEALRIPLARGRLLERADRNGVARAIVVSQSLVDRYYPDQDPIGKQLELSISFGYDVAGPWTVVGVVGDIRSNSLTTDPEPEIYVPHAQMAGGYMEVVVRTAPGVTDVLESIRREIRTLDPNVPLRGIRTLEATVDRAVGPTRFYLMLLAVFAAVAVALAAVGLYGVAAYLVSRRTREIGVRIALGAQRADVLRLVLLQGIRPVLIGVVVGLGGAYAGSRLLQSLLYNVEPGDLTTAVVVTALLLAVVVAAIALPARRASRIAPVEALREA
jgi:predicted permease